MLSVCLCAVLGRRIEIGKSWNLDNWQEVEAQPLTIDNYDPVLAAEGKVLLKIIREERKLEKEKADVEMDIMNRQQKHQNQPEKHQHHPRQHHYLGESDDEDHEYLGEGSGILRYFAM